MTRLRAISLFGKGFSNKKARNLCGDSGPFRYKEKKILHDCVWYFKNAAVFVFGNGILIVAVDNGTAIFFEYENGITGRGQNKIFAKGLHIGFILGHRKEPATAAQCLIGIENLLH